MQSELVSFETELLSMSVRISITALLALSLWALRKWLRILVLKSK
jgi:hypothetical protein